MKLHTCRCRVRYRVSVKTRFFNKKNCCGINNLIAIISTKQWTIAPNQTGFPQSEFCQHQLQSSVKSESLPPWIRHCDHQQVLVGRCFTKGWRRSLQARYRNQESEVRHFIHLATTCSNVTLGRSVFQGSPDTYPTYWKQTANSICSFNHFTNIAQRNKLQKYRAEIWHVYAVPMINH